MFCDINKQIAHRFSATLYITIQNEMLEYDIDLFIMRAQSFECYVQGLVQIKVRHQILIMSYDIFPNFQLKILFFMANTFQRYGLYFIYSIFRCDLALVQPICDIIVNSCTQVIFYEQFDFSGDQIKGRAGVYR